MTTVPLSSPFFLSTLINNCCAGSIISLPLIDSFDVKTNPCILTFPSSSSVKPGQKLTLHFLVSGYYWCQASDTNTNFSDVSMGNKIFTDLIYSSLPLPGPETVYHCRTNHAQITCIDSVTFTAREVSVNGVSGINWVGVSTRNKLKFLAPGSHNFAAPNDATSFLFIGAGGGAGGGKYTNLTDSNGGHSAVSGAGGGSGAFGAYTRSIVAGQALEITVGSGGNVGENGGNTELSVDSEKLILGGGQTGQNAIFNKSDPSSSQPAQGGLGGQVQYLINGTSSAFPLINFVALPGAKGGDAGPFLGNNSFGSAGSTFVTAPSNKSSGGNLQVAVNGAYVTVSAPGGGAGSYLSAGATPASFKFAGSVILNWSQIAGGRAVSKNSAAGGAGQSPNDSDNLSRGAGGFGLLLFN